VGKIKMIKLKDIIEESKFGGYNVELGRVYTDKDLPPFKTPSQVKEETKDTHEISIGISSVKTSVRSAKIIYDEIKKRNLNELDGWVQEKLTTSSDLLKEVAEYLQNIEE
jgi:hypothetical protein